MKQRFVSRVFFPLLGAVVVAAGAGSFQREALAEQTVTKRKPVAVQSAGVGNAKALTKFVRPRDPRGNAKGVQLFKAHIAKNGPVPLAPATKLAKTRGLIARSAYAGTMPYWGLGEFQYYTNDGAQGRDWMGKVTDETWRSCGQAAAATLLRYWKAIPDERGNGPVAALWNKYPADGYLGMAGTSWQRVNSMLKDKGLTTAIYQGETALRNTVGNGKPVIVMVDVGKFREWNYSPGGHWVVVYGYTDKNVYLTNWNGKVSTSWEQFRSGWINNIIVNGGGMSERMIAAWGNNGHL